MSDPIADSGRSKAPDHCLYCKGDDPECGFCDMGKPLDTQEDWDNSWGRIFNARRVPSSERL